MLQLDELKFVGAIVFFWKSGFPNINNPCPFSQILNCFAFWHWVKQPSLISNSDDFSIYSESICKNNLYCILDKIALDWVKIIGSEKSLVSSLFICIYKALHFF
ncbi:hypothetical protein [Mycoplasma feriruminatoris]|uniref:hypothetical protein n=1 Tax=Mycoplasma feriruminatoris TaxID=1179777 RepID=UPI00241F6B8C|nr:hypothetical protein [Mycoplasma feriruminatoris]